MSDSPVSVTLTLNDDEVRVVADALDTFCVDMFDIDGANDADLEVACSLLQQLGRDCAIHKEPGSWDDMDSPLLPDPDEVGDQP